MGRITLGQFNKATQGAGDDAKLRLGSAGEVKTAKHGLLGRAVRWLSGATKQDRAGNQKIMGDLVAGLKQKYGSEIGVDAFLRAVPDARIRDDGVLEAKTTKPLTARQVRNAQHTAEVMLARNRGANQKTLTSYQARVGDENRRGFDGLAAELKLPRLTSLERQAYNTRLEERVKYESHLHRKVLTPAQMDRIAKDTIQQVQKLSKTGGLVDASRARAAYDLALMSLVDALAQGKDAKALAGLLGTANDRLNEHLVAEGIEQDPGGGERKELTELALHRCGLSQQNLRLAQSNALKNDAPLRALSAAARDVMYTGSFTGEPQNTETARGRQEVAGGVLSIASSVVRALGFRLDPVTASPDQDAARLADEDVSDDSKQRAMQALANAMGETIY